MAKEQEGREKLFDMNGNVLREGDLVMVLLDKPVFTGYVTIETQMIRKNPVGVIVVTGIVRLRFDPTKPAQIMQQMAKVVDPRSAALIESLTHHTPPGAADIELPPRAEKEPPKEKEPVVEEPTGPVLVPTEPDSEAPPEGAA